MRSLFVTLTSLLVAAPFGAMHAQHTHDHVSPYTAFVDRDIKALSDDEIAALLDGAGGGMALAAELNRFPGPRHVLDMAPMLGLSEEQAAAVRGIFETMQTQARVLGREIVDRERALDRAFADGAITDTALRQQADAIAALTGQLRYTHLRAHLQVGAVLTAAQRQQYERARGYAR